MSEPNEDAIEFAERLLRKLRTGEVQGFVTVFQKAGRFEWMRVGDCDTPRMIGALVLVQQLEVEELRERATRPPDTPEIGVVEIDDDDEDEP